ncbi:11862_t:CDS:2 [Cetraspora pellucida]|uniref:11862_t:CDS:1 n=1 Tax=Cetraspora pellucida TaxID=1433469 RepID=A0ACA9K2J1_9GLOM|nr:11862_t:CDS:2 [Cetraspora pellucida]
MPDSPGISGLTTAVLLQDEYDITIVSREFPGELKDGYASPWAGAHWRSRAELEDIRQQGIALKLLLNYIPVIFVNSSIVSKGFDRETFIHFWNFACTRPSETGVMIVDGFDYWDELPLGWNDPWFKDLCPEYRHLTKDELPTNVEFGIKYKTVTINPLKHISYLLACFYALGGTTELITLSHIQEAIFDNTDIVINCSGLGSRTLGGVQDQDVYPASGQTVLVQLPIGHVNWRFSRYVATSAIGTSEIYNYVIPRDNGEVFLGATYNANFNILNMDLSHIDLISLIVSHPSSTIPDAKIADRIIERCLSTRPDLLPEGETKLNIKRHGVGLRPVRENGIRIEAEWILSEKTGKKILLCHNYGHGGYGWQSSYGASLHVIQTLKQALREGQEQISNIGVKL